MKFRPGQLIFLKAGASATGYDATIWQSIRLQDPDASTSGHICKIEQLLPLLVIGEASHVRRDGGWSEYKWIEVLCGDRQLVVYERYFE
jgi:hypothetical protein